MPDFEVRCLEPVTYQGGDEGLPLTIDEKQHGVTLKIGGFNKRLTAGLPDRLLDLLEIATLVYGMDAAVSRGGTTDRKMGQAWYRQFNVEMPVRDPDFWNAPAIKDALEEMLLFLSDDRFGFDFVVGQHSRMESKWFDFGKDEGWQADRVLMFSGGLDSFAGALEEVIEQRNRVALVSHFSSTKIAPVQRSLCTAIAAKEGAEALRHFPMRIQLWRRSHQESTHRTRSFLFAVLGLMTTLAFGETRVSFHENGVVSLNLPPVGSVVGARATKTTHPQTLSLFSHLFSLVFEREIRVDNPFFWRTKTEVLQTIDRLGMADQVRVSSSCADTHNRTKQHPHCGRCSQCIDRRFAVLASGMARHDPGEAYAKDLLEAPRDAVVDRELSMSYLRNALAFEVMAPQDLEARFPDVLSAVSHLQLSPDVALSRISELLKRHGAAVSGAMREALKVRTAEDYPEGSLPRLFGDIQRAQALGLPAIRRCSSLLRQQQHGSRWPSTATGTSLCSTML